MYVPSSDSMPQSLFNYPYYWAFVSYFAGHDHYWASYILVCLSKSLNADWLNL